MNTSGKPFVVVGAGLAGLTAANALADLGFGVTVLEQSERLGGRAITRNHSGYLMNLGPHALYCGGRARQTFKDWGISFSGSRPALSAGAYLVYRGERYPFFANLTGLLRHPLFSFREKIDLMRVFRLLMSRSETTSHSAPAPLSDSMSTWIARYAHSERVADFLRAATRLSTFATDFDHLSAERAVAQLRMAFSSSVLYLDGGWQTLVDGLADRARARGIEIKRGVPVQKLSEIDAAGVILAVPPESVERITGSPIRNLRPCRMACLQIGLRSPQNRAKSANSREPAAVAKFTPNSRGFAANLPQKRAPASAAPATFALGVDQPFYFSVHSAYAKLAPEGAAVIHAAKYLDNAKHPDNGKHLDNAKHPDNGKHLDNAEHLDSAKTGDRRDRAELEDFCDLAIPGWRHDAEFVQFLPDMTVTHAMASTGGRPGVDALGIDGVAIAGDWVGPEGMLSDAAVSSALRAAQVVTQKAARAAA